MKILIVSGFLGAGKTTFIKELIKRSGILPVVLENEYGSNNIDAAELDRAGSGEMKVLEFMEGCVCCTMKDSFVNSVLTVSAGLDPEYLIVEPTGVGRLSSILRNLEPLLYDKISLLGTIVVLSPGQLERNLREYGGLYADQVENAGTIVLSKTEHEDPEVIRRAAEKLRELNPRALILSEHYTGMPDEWWKGLIGGKEGAGGNAAPAPEESGEEENPFMQLSLTDVRLDNVGQLVVLLEDCLHGEFGHLVRAKGSIRTGGELCRFDIADRLYAIGGAEEEQSNCVFIGEDLDKKKLCERLGKRAYAGLAQAAGKLPRWWDGNA